MFKIVLLNNTLNVVGMDLCGLPWYKTTDNDNKPTDDTNDDNS